MGTNLKKMMYFCIIIGLATNLNEQIKNASSASIWSTDRLM